MKTKVIIGVDAGGTKTKVCVFDLKGKILLEHVGGVGSPAVLGNSAIDYIMGLVKNVMLSVMLKHEIIYIQAGISGLGTVPNVSEYEDIYTESFKVKVSMVNDAITLWHAIFKNKFNAGISVVSGTGSSCLAINKNKEMLIGGWGHLITETGSAYAAVRMLVVNMIYEYETNNKLTKLGAKFLEELGYGIDIYKIKIFMYKSDKKEIAAKAKFISEEAIKGDEEAISILKRCGKDLALAINNGFKHLKMDDTAGIGFSGSFVLEAPYVKEALISKLDYKNNLVEFNEDQVIGCYYLAMKKV